MPKYTVTGGEDGQSGVEVARKRYEPGASLDMPTKKAEWLVDIGILVAAGGKAFAPEAEEE